ncbi:shikimate dehydrogenase [Vagococcus sp. BWB3-3]|uniref:Shikimate dehydrogenase (NADP(+)) n=1 Tax=Vagococcus allomyrinae TaxID=2794353 RepID=A0A940PF80_9ENTE|nr:shikimate dehydrogenase [Vagococcus allomyrinae]MBP1041738.1 shikimate dehydrogenase [Vagococcus allomyrinae]
MITGETKLAAVLATPIKHSISPLIHNTAFKALGIDAVYLAFEVGTEELAASLETIKTFNLMGVNLSMPNKQLGYQLVDEASEVAHLVQSINTVVHQNGKLIGYNTDGYGFMESLRDENIDIIDQKFVFLGGGGAAISIIAQAAVDGAKEIVVFNRSGNSYQQVEERLTLIAKQTSCIIKLFPLERQELLKSEIATANVLVNATSVGMSPDVDGCLIPDGRWLRPDLAVTDIVYEPRETKLLTMAKKQGCRTVNGLGMLLHQGAQAFQLWTGQPMPIEVVRSAIKKI